MFGQCADHPCSGGAGRVLIDEIQWSFVLVFGTLGGFDLGQVGFIWYPVGEFDGAHLFVARLVRRFNNGAGSFMSDGIAHRLFEFRATHRDGQTEACHALVLRRGFQECRIQVADALWQRDASSIRGRHLLATGTRGRHTLDAIIMSIKWFDESIVNACVNRLSVQCIGDLEFALDAFLEDGDGHASEMLVDETGRRQFHRVLGGKRIVKRRLMVVVSIACRIIHAADVHHHVTGINHLLIARTLDRGVAKFRQAHQDGTGRCLVRMKRPVVRHDRLARTAVYADLGIVEDDR